MHNVQRDVLDKAVIITEIANLLQVVSDLQEVVFDHRGQWSVDSTKTCNNVVQENVNFKGPV